MGQVPVKAEPLPGDQLLRNASRAAYWAWGKGANQRRGCSLGDDSDRNTRGRKKTGQSRKLGGISQAGMCFSTAVTNVPFG